jgi:hypothetical protein
LACAHALLQINQVIAPTYVLVRMSSVFKVRAEAITDVILGPLAALPAQVHWV